MADDSAAPNEVMFSTMIGRSTREAIRAEAKERNVPMSVLVREVFAERFGVTERKRKPRSYAADLPKLDQGKLDLEISETEAA